MDLPAPVARFVDRVQRVSERIGIALQKAVLTVLLTVIYVVGVGLTRLLAMVFARSHLTLYEGPSKAPTYWKDAQGYTPDRVGLHKQF